MKKIRKNKLGFNYIYPLPNKQKMEDYYRNKYFKKTISYKDKLKKEEESYHRCVALIQIYMLNKRVKKLNKKNLLDLGAGKGTFISNITKFFKSCLGVDFSFNNLSKKNKSKIKFVSMNPEHFIEKNLKRFDVITLNNVLEHVPDPTTFMINLKKNIKKNTLIILTVPSDFSDLQKETNKKVSKKNYWMCPPEHLSYFNKKNFINFSNKIGFKVLDAIADFPIELFLLKKNFDYTKDKKLGKNIHLLRCEIMAYLEKHHHIEKLYNLFKMFYELNIGRDNIFLLKKI